MFIDVDAVADVFGVDVVGAGAGAVVVFVAVSNRFSFFPLLPIDKRRLNVCGKYTRSYMYNIPETEPTSQKTVILIYACLFTSFAAIIIGPGIHFSLYFCSTIIIQCSRSFIFIYLFFLED